MCDGYYFPISSSVPRSAFHRDATLCRANCGHDAKLFYHSATAGDATTMIDLTGRAYARLPQAFRYRKTLVDGCKCKPEPWAQSEIDRHRLYAAVEAQLPPETQDPGNRAVAEQSGSDARMQEVSPEPPSVTAPTPDPSVATPHGGRDLAGYKSPPTVGSAPSGSQMRARPATPAPKRISGFPKATAPLGLGGQGLRWPGD